MLVLSRFENETINLYDPSGVPIGFLTVVRIEGGKVRLGFDFPSDYNIVRGEIDDGRAHKRPPHDLTRRGKLA